MTRELDALVAEKVMGWKLIENWGSDGPVEEGWVGFWDDEWCRWIETPNLEVKTWNPSAPDGIADAWMVVEKMMHVSIENLGSKWKVEFSADTHGLYWATADTAPEAICLAALKAVGYEDVAGRA